MKIWRCILKIDKINVFSQTATKRTFVGILYRQNSSFHFKYDKQYRHNRDAVALGPELELWKEKFSSKSLFPSIADRIPSKQNPAYKDYCSQWGISENEKDAFRLLTTIGRRGPSTFVFEPVPKEYSAENIKTFRKKLRLNQRDFAALFDITQATLSKIEQGKSTHGTVMVFIQLCDEISEALHWLLNVRGQYIHDNLRVYIERLFKKRGNKINSF